MKKTLDNGFDAQYKTRNEKRSGYYTSFTLGFQTNKKKEKKHAIIKRLVIQMMKSDYSNLLLTTVSLKPTSIPGGG